MDLHDDDDREEDLAFCVRSSDGTFDPNHEGDTQHHLHLILLRTQDLRRRRVLVVGLVYMKSLQYAHVRYTHT